MVTNQQAFGNWKRCENLLIQEMLLHLQFFNAILAHNHQNPTRFVTTFPLAQSFPWQGWPQFDEDRSYLGPLPAACSHPFQCQKTYRERKRQMENSRCGGLPASTLQMAGTQLIVSRKGESLSELNKQPERPLERLERPVQTQAHHEATAVEESQHQATQEADQDVPSEEQTAGQNTKADVRQHLHRGQKITLEWAGRARELVDGFGLCSPTLWEPSCRGAHMSAEAKGLCMEIFEMLSTFVDKKFADPRRRSNKTWSGPFFFIPIH